MDRLKGLSAAVMGALSHTEWMTTREVTTLVAKEYRSRAGTILCQRVIKGDVLREGEHRAYRYRLVKPIETTASLPQEAAVESVGGGHG